MEASLKLIERTNYNEHSIEATAVDLSPLAEHCPANIDRSGPYFSRV